MNDRLLSRANLPVRTLTHFGRREEGRPMMQRRVCVRAVRVGFGLRIPDSKDGRRHCDRRQGGRGLAA